MRKLYLLILLCHTIPSLCMAPERLRNAVTHGIPIGRMGDFLTWYIKAKYVAHKFRFPFLLNVPYNYLEDVKRLNLYQQEKRLDHHLYVVNYMATVKTEDDLIKVRKPIFVVEHEFHSEGWSRVDDLEDVSGWHDVLNDTEFRDILRNMIKLTIPVDIGLKPPTDCISVALHIRTGEKWDTDGNRKQWYFKFPTIDFYVDALRNLTTLIPNTKIHVTLFTDDLNPVDLMNNVMTQLGSPHVRFRCRSVGNYPTRNVLDDLEAMKQYDCLIRGMSGFAQVAHLIGDYKIVIYPLKFNEQQVTQIAMMKKSNYKELFQQEHKLP